MSKTLDNLSIGLDVDGLLACFPCGVLKRAQSLGLQNKFPNSCKLVSTWDMSESFQEVMKDVWKDDSFWLNLPRLYTKNLPFKPAAYITNRHISSDTTKQWLISMGFPNAEVVTVKTYKDKLQEIQKRKINVFVDDYFLTVKHLRDNGINALLWEQPYQFGHKNECELPTINKLEDIVNYV